MLFLLYAKIFNTFIQQGYIYNITKISNKRYSFKLSFYQRIMKKKSWLSLKPAQLFLRLIIVRNVS